VRKGQSEFSGTNVPVGGTLVAGDQVPVDIRAPPPATRKSADALTPAPTIEERRMPFQISELVIRVTGDSPDGAIDNKQSPPAVSECRQGGHTCLPDVTDCRKGGTTCMPPDVPSTCREHTCVPAAPGKPQPKKAELDFVLQQVRDAVAAEPANDEELVTA
jgi:hypothetical protein